MEVALCHRTLWIPVVCIYMEMWICVRVIAKEITSMIIPRIIESSLGRFGQGLNNHTDQSVPAHGIPALLLVVNYIEGTGYNTLVDGYAVAQALRSRDPAAFDLRLCWRKLDLGYLGAEKERIERECEGHIHGLLRWFHQCAKIWFDWMICPILSLCSSPTLVIFGPLQHVQHLPSCQGWLPMETARSGISFDHGWTPLRKALNPCCWPPIIPSSKLMGKARANGAAGTGHDGSEIGLGWWNFGFCQSIGWFRILMMLGLQGPMNGFKKWSWMHRILTSPKP